jgi:hypothetical protein
MPYRIIAEQALARWRASLANLDVTSPGTPEWEAARVAERRAKAAYQEAAEAARTAHLPEPPSREAG